MSSRLCSVRLMCVLMAALASLAPAQCPLNATSTNLGGGCGAPTAAVLTIDPPVIGSSATLAVTSSFPSSPLYIFMSVGAPAPYPVPGTPCVVHVDVANLSNLYLLPPFYTDPNGSFSLTAQIANDPALEGAVFTFQARVWFPGGPLNGDHPSNGVRIRFGCGNASIGDTVFCDVDNDGQQGPNEPGIPNVAVLLSCANGFTATTTTDANGHYLFSDLPPGECTVSMDAGTLPAGKTPGNCAGSYTVPLQVGQFFDAADFCATDCAGCDGGVNDLTIRYNGTVANANVNVREHPGHAVLFDGVVQPGETFSFVGTGPNGTMGDKIHINVTGGPNTNIDVDCSKDIGPGLVKNDYEVVSGTSVNGGALCPLGPCARGKPCRLVLRYTGDDCSVTSHNQDPSKVFCAGDPAHALVVMIRASDDDDPNAANALVWFQGLVNLDTTFDLEAALGGENKLKAETHLHIFDATGTTLLQQLEFHTSCSQPLAIGNRFGAVTLEAMFVEGECN